MSPEELGRVDGRAPAWRCPVCGGTSHRARFRGRSRLVQPTTENFRPSAERFGETSGEIVRCLACGHGSLAEPPADEDVSAAYADAADDISLREEEGQVETARRQLVLVEREVSPGKALDVGCWTGSFLVAATERGWDAEGVEPSEWAVGRALERGIKVQRGDLDSVSLTPGGFRLVIMCDVLEHLAEPRPALSRLRDLLEPGGALFLTVPNAGSLTARALGKRWWSVLPMHLQYFTPRSMRLALETTGFEVRLIKSHAKAFSARYYAERLGGYSEAVGKGVVRMVERLGAADRMVAPDFHDRMAVIAIRAED